MRGELPAGGLLARHPVLPARPRRPRQGLLPAGLHYQRQPDDAAQQLLHQRHAVRRQLRQPDDAAGRDPGLVGLQREGEENNRLLAHPFHIHINPFQITRNSDNTLSPPLIWWDTIALQVTGPGTSNDALAGPIWDNEDAKKKCPAVCLKASNASWNGQWTTIEPDVSRCAAA